MFFDFPDLHADPLVTSTVPDPELSPFFYKSVERSEILVAKL
jgi:hypothetical protein